MAVTAAAHRPVPSLPVPWFDLALALAVTGYAVIATALDPDLAHPWTELAATLMVAPLLLRNAHPFAMALLSAAGVLGYAALPESASPLWTFIGVLLICFSVGAALDGRRRWVALGVLLLSAYVLQLSSTDRGDPGQNAFSEVWISPLVIIGGPAFAGALLRRSREQTEKVRRLAAALDEERQRHAEAAAVAERNRIARELHDVISHGVSVMVVQAGAAEQTLPDGVARERVHAIRETGKEALAELRRQLGLLRTGAEESPAPLPGLAELPRLVAEMHAELATTGATGVLPVGVELTAYRVVQEALTNCQRHAAGSPARVALSREDGTLLIDVTDQGGEATGPGTGNGLRGMRERVELYGGTVTAGPRPGNAGWQVHVELPLPTDGAQGRSAR